MNEKNISKEPVDLWELTEHLPDFEDECEIWQANFYTIYNTLGKDFTGSIVGYVEPKENKDYSYVYASGRYTLSAYTPDGELLQELNAIADIFVRWVGLHKLPFVGYVYKKTDTSLPEGIVWIIAPKSKEQLLSCAATFYKRRKKVGEAPNILDLAPYLKKATSIGKVTDAASFVPLRKRQMEGKERRTATKKRIAEYRAESSEYTDEKLTALVESMFPNEFVSNEVSIEVVKELYRESLPLTEENFNEVLRYLYDERKILGYHIASMEQSEIANTKSNLIRKIYKDANERTVYLSQYPGFSGKVKESFETAAREKGKTLAQILYSLLNVEAMYQTSEDAIVQRNYLTFHCYSEPNGDVIFTKDKRTRADYDEDGKPIEKEKQAPLAPEQKKEPEQKSGCLGAILFTIVIVIFLSI